MLRAFRPALTAALLFLAPTAASADCKLLQIAEFHADVLRGVPIISGQINGQPIKILIDSGSAASIVIRNSAKRLGLAEGRVTGSRMYGLGGSTETGTVMIKQLKVDNYATTDLEFRVAGAPADKFPFDLILGDDFLSKADVEFDLADGFIRMFKPQGCAPAQLVYWGKPYSQAVLLPSPNVAPATQAEVLLNGRKFTGTLDTGASQTVVDSTVAESVGVTRQSIGAKDSGAVRGLGPGTEETWTANFDSFTLGDETIGHPRIQVSQLLSAFQETYTGSRLAYRLTNAPPMLIGADFLRAHRVFVGNLEHVMVVRYNGGPVFQSAEDLAMFEANQAIAADPGAVDAYANRGFIESDRRDFSKAISDFDQAIRLRPNDANALNGRCWARASANIALVAALVDCNASLAVTPHDADVLDSRAFVYFRLGQFDKAVADDNAALGIAPKAASTLYVRGLAKRRLGDGAGGDADLAAAKAIYPKVADAYARLGVTP